MNGITTSPAAPTPRAGRHASGDARAVGCWLAAWAALILAIILVGGATRLTESGLSITEWKPVRGIVPPLNEAAWATEFEKYRRIPQYERLNAGMSLDAFKTIYLWEFWHRIVARLAGLAYVLPLAWFAARGRIPAIARRRVYALLVLLLAQAAMGWWMVTSGLTVRTEVSQYRLAAHLLVALVILALTVWTAADLLDGPRRATRAADVRRSRALGALLALVFVTSGSGALVAGLRAGRAFNTFPLMGGRVVPAGYGQLAPWWRNVFENHAAVQFHHRVLAVTTFLAVVALWAIVRGSPDRRVAARMHLVLAAALLQLGLGIATLLLAVPTALGVAHQGGAALLLIAVLLTWHANGTPVPQAVNAARGPARRGAEGMAPIHPGARTPRRVSHVATTPAGR